MSLIAKTIYFYSFYLFLMGLGMIFIPNILLSIFGFEQTTEIWIRMLGLFTFTTGIYYFYSARNGQTEFFKSTIIGRLFFFLMTIIFVFVFEQSPMLAAIGSVDFFGALWTFSSYQKARKL